MNSRRARRKMGGLNGNTKNVTINHKEYEKDKERYDHLPQMDTFIQVYKSGFEDGTESVPGIDNLKSVKSCPV